MGQLRGARSDRIGFLMVTRQAGSGPAFGVALRLPERSRAIRPLRVVS